jgi:hypothetical protein
MPYSQSQLKVSDITDNTGIACLGSVLRGQKSAKWYFLTLHWNPSAGCRIVLKSDLTPEDARTDGVSATLASGLAIVDGDMVHFAAAHPQTLFSDPRTHQASQLYLPQHDPFLVDFSSRLKKRYSPIAAERITGDATQTNSRRISSYPLVMNNDLNVVAFRASLIRRASSTAMR